MEYGESSVRVKLFFDDVPLSVFQKLILRLSFILGNDLVYAKNSENMKNMQQVSDYLGFVSGPES